MPTTVDTLTVTPETARTVRESVEAGEYRSELEAVEDAVRVWRRERDDRAKRLDAIRTHLRSSLADPGPDLSIDEVKQHLMELTAAEVAGDGAT